MENFDPNNNFSKNLGAFGLPVISIEEASLVLTSVPWEVTVSYRATTAKAPKTIEAASGQIDLADAFAPRQWVKGIYWQKFPKWLFDFNKVMRKKAENIISFLENESLVPDRKTEENLCIVNDGCRRMNDFVYESVKDILSQGKISGVVGGDHSVAFGSIKAHCEKYENMGILQFDAHADLRQAYEGFEFSHASVMYNCIEYFPQVSNLVQVGIRDYSEAEAEYTEIQKGKISTFYNHDIKKMLYEGKNWSYVCEKIIGKLPENVYISFDIDGLSPLYCPETGTPVPGGQDFDEVIFLLRKMVESGRKIIGFDLCEVGSTAEWDNIVGSRILYQLIILALKSHEKN